MKRLSSALAVILILSVWLSACGTGSAGGAVGAVQNWLAVYAQYDSKGVIDLTCLAQKAQITQAVAEFNNTDLATLKDLFVFNFARLTFKENSNDGKTAVIHLGGQMAVTIFGQTQNQDMDQDVPVVFENGQWKVCGSLPK
jgi:hypothetical protein